MGETQDHRSDIFSVGIVLYQLTTGLRPFDGSSVEAVCAQIVAKQPAPPSRYNPALPPQFDRIVMRCLAKNPSDRYASGESLAASLYPFARSKPEPAPHRFNFSWFRGPIRPAEAWMFSAAVAAALVAIPVGHNFYRMNHPQQTNSQRASFSPPMAAAPLEQQPLLNFNAPVADGSANAGAVARKAAQPLAAKTRDTTSSGSPATAPARETSPSVAISSSAISADASNRPLPVSSNKPSLPASRSAPGTAASLGIEISSAIDGATLAVFADQQLLVTSALSVTRPGESLHLDRPLSAGPHEFRVALYRQDQTLQTAKQGLAELHPGPSNQLTVHVVRRSKMLVKRNADLDILWPSSLPSSPSNSPSSPSKSRTIDTHATKGSTPLVATSATSQR
jgi:serine/threonine protein kinase